MQTTIRNYDLDAARARLRARLSLARGLGDQMYSTHLVRELQGCADALRAVAAITTAALEQLSAAEGGAARLNPSTNRWEASPAGLDPEMPLVQALLVLRAHPAYPKFEEIMLARGYQDVPRPWEGGPHDAAPVLERFYADARPTWSVRALEQLVFECARAAFGEEPLDADWTPDQIYPGSRVAAPFRVLYAIMILDAFGAFEPGFTRQDAMRGEWWLIQPVSPRLVHREIAMRADLELAGYLPAGAVDASGRVVMACYEREPMDAERRAELLDESKWVKGWQRATWTRDAAPLDDPAFDLIPRLEGITPESYGAYRHSSELPPYPPR